MSRTDTVCFIGVIMQVDRASELKTSNGRFTKRRLLLLADDSNCNVRCTLWGEEALEATAIARGHPTLILNGEINDYNDTRSINVGGSARAVYDPQLPRAENLNNWYEQLDSDTQLLFPTPSFS